jgi:hypothetical protein
VLLLLLLLRRRRCRLLLLVLLVLLLLLLLVLQGVFLLHHAAEKGIHLLLRRDAVIIHLAVHGFVKLSSLPTPSVSQNVSIGRPARVSPAGRR